MRSDEERAANDNIEAAIERYREAYRATNPEATHGTLVDWIVVAAEIKPGDNADEDVTAYSIIMPNGSVPWYRAVGLLEAGKFYLMRPESDE